MPKPTEKKAKKPKAHGKSGLPHGKKQTTVGRFKLTNEDLELVADALLEAQDSTIADATTLAAWAELESEIRVVLAGIAADEVDEEAEVE